MISALLIKLAAVAAGAAASWFGALRGRAQREASAWARDRVRDAVRAGVAAVEQRVRKTMAGPVSEVVADKLRSVALDLATRNLGPKTMDKAAKALGLTGPVFLDYLLNQIEAEVLHGKK